MKYRAGGAQHELSCQHRVRFEKPWPGLGSEIYCIKCNDITTVVFGPTTPSNHTLRCSCGYTRHFGVERLRTETAATRHHQKYPAHEVSLMAGGQVYHVMRSSYRTQPLLPLGFDDDPSF